LFNEPWAKLSKSHIDTNVGTVVIGHSGNLDEVPASKSPWVLLGACPIFTREFSSIVQTALAYRMPPGSKLFDLFVHCQFIVFMNR
jgi:hypothetical protein